MMIFITSPSHASTFQAEDEKGAPDLALVQRRIKDIVGVLENFSSRRSMGMSRGDYIQQVLVSRCHIAFSKHNP